MKFLFFISLFLLTSCGIIIKGGIETNILLLSQKENTFVRIEIERNKRIYKSNWYHLDDIYGHKLNLSSKDLKNINIISKADNCRNKLFKIPIVKNGAEAQEYGVISAGVLLIMLAPNLAFLPPLAIASLLLGSITSGSGLIAYGIDRYLGTNYKPAVPLLDVTPYCEIDIF